MLVQYVSKLVNVFMADIRQTLNMVHNGFVIYGTFTGIGTFDARLSIPQMIEGAKVGASLNFDHQPDSELTSLDT